MSGRRNAQRIERVPHPSARLPGIDEGRDRRKAIAEALADGMTVAQAAARFGVSERWVRVARKEFGHIVR